MMKFLGYVAIISFIYFCLKGSSNNTPQSDPTPPPDTVQYGMYNWGEDKSIPLKDMDEYVRIDAQTVYHKDSIPEGVKVLHYIRPPKVDVRKAKRDYNLTEDDIREIVRQEIQE